MPQLVTQERLLPRKRSLPYANESDPLDQTIRTLDQIAFHGVAHAIEILVDEGVKIHLS